MAWLLSTALFTSRLSLIELITSFGVDIMEYLSHISRAGNFHFPHILYKQYKCSRRKPMELWSNQFCWWSQFTPHTPTFPGILNFSVLHTNTGRNRRPKVIHPWSWKDIVCQTDVSLCPNMMVRKLASPTNGWQYDTY